MSEEHVDQCHDRFLPPKKLLSKQDLTLALHRAVVEVFTLREAGRPMTDATNAKDDRIIPDTSQVGILLSGQEQAVALSYPDEQTKEAILQSTVLSEPVEEVTNVQTEVEEARAGMEKDTAGQSSLQDVESTPVEEVMQQNTNPSLSAPKQATLPSDSTWLNISLLDPAVKFAVSPIHISSLPFSPPPTETQSTDHQAHNAVNRHTRSRPNNPPDTNRPTPPLASCPTAKTEETCRGPG